MRWVCFAKRTPAFDSSFGPCWRWPVMRRTWHNEKVWPSVWVMSAEDKRGATGSHRADQTLSCPSYPHLLPSSTNNWDTLSGTILSSACLTRFAQEQERFTCPTRSRVPVLDTRARDQLVTWPLISTRQSALRWATIYSLFAYFRLNGIKRGFKTREQSREYLQADFARQRARNVQLLKHTLEIVLGTKPFARLDNFPLKQRFKEKQVTFIIFTQVRSGCLSQGCTYVPPWVFSPLNAAPQSRTCCTNMAQLYLVGGAWNFQ